MFLLSAAAENAMPQYDKSDFVVACSMVSWVDANPMAEPRHVYASYWIAFNNIYVTLADFRGKAASLNKDSNGSVKMIRVDGNDMPKVTPVKEREQIEIAIKELADNAKAELVGHKNVIFFVNRSPVFGQYPLEKNKAGQKLNGVLNVGYSYRDYPVWSPLNREAHAKVKSKSASKADIDLLAKQIVDMLYTIRNNLFHGGKRADDAQNQEILKNAIPLLEIVVRFFLRDKP
jgi:hypothetical protein